MDLTVDMTVAETEDMVAGTDEGSRTVTVMAAADTPATDEAGAPSEAAVTVTDNDTRGVVVSGSPLTVNENSTGGDTVVLTSRPTEEVTITPSSDNSDVASMPTTLTCTADNWSTAQEVMVTAVQDGDSTDDSATIFMPLRARMTGRTTSRQPV